MKREWPRLREWRGSALPLAVTVAASLAVLVTSILPWLRVGAGRRNAFGVLRAAEALGYIEGAALRALSTLWYLLPLLVAATWTAGALRRRVAVATLGATVGGMAIAAGLLVSLSIRAEVGPIASICSGVAAVVGAGWLMEERER